MLFPVIQHFDLWQVILNADGQIFRTFPEDTHSAQTKCLNVSGNLIDSPVYTKKTNKSNGQILINLGLHMYSDLWTLSEFSSIVNMLTCAYVILQII